MAIYRYLHQATGAGAGRQPADPADRFQGGDQPADPAVSETVEHRDHRDDGLSRRLAGPDAGLHHHADRAGGGRRRRRRLHDLGLDPGPEPDFGLRQAERRSERGAHRGDVEGQLGQVPDPARGQRSDHPEVDRPDHRRDVSRLLQRRTVGLGDFGLPDARGAADPVDGRRRGVGGHSRRPDLRDAAVARSAADGGTRRVA